MQGLGLGEQTLPALRDRRQKAAPAFPGRSHPIPPPWGGCSAWGSGRHLVPQLPALAPTPTHEVKVRATQGHPQPQTSPSPPGELYKKTLMQPQQQQQLPEITLQAHLHAEPQLCPGWSIVSQHREHGWQRSHCHQPTCRPHAVPTLRDAYWGSCPCTLSVPRAAQRSAASQGHSRTMPGPSSAAVGVWLQAALASPGNTAFL
mgnify:CR=1 FL=1